MRRRIHKLRIHPAVGIARVGRSPEGFFIGPEIPGVAPAPPRTADAPAGFRDRKGHLKRQAARFRVFAYDKSDRLIGEVTGREAKIVWTVHLRNTKAAGRRFDGLKRRTPPRNPRWRDRRSLVLDPAPAPARVQGAGARLDLLCFQFMKRAFQQPLKLGTLRTDAFGRLLVLGGHGHAGTLTDAALDAGENNYANRDGWYDDVSDGPVTAIQGGTDRFERRNRALPRLVSRDGVRQFARCARQGESPVRWLLGYSGAAVPRSRSAHSAPDV